MDEDDLMRAPVVSSPSSEAITTAEARQHCGIPSADTTHDTYLDSLVTAARQKWERDTGRIVMSCTVVEKLDCWPEEVIELAVSPVQSVTSIYYLNASGASTLWSSSEYVFDSALAKPSIYLAYDENWPELRGWAADVTITYVAGYANAAAVPKLWKQAMLLLVSHWFENRATVNIGNITNEIPLAYEAIAANYMRPTYP